MGSRPSRFPKAIAFLRRPQCHDIVAGTATLALLALSGCGNGTVTANGHITIEGKPASGGRLSLTPVGGGPRAFSLIDKDGAFALRSGDDSLGAVPGSYYVFLDQPLDEQTRRQYARELAGQLDVNQFSFTFECPRDKPRGVGDREADAVDVALARHAGNVARVR